MLVVFILFDALTHINVPFLNIVCVILCIFVTCFIFSCLGTNVESVKCI